MDNDFIKQFRLYNPDIFGIWHFEPGEVERIVEIIGFGEMEVKSRQGTDLKKTFLFRNYVTGEVMKPALVNKVNPNTIASVLGTRNRDEWIGKLITIYPEPSVKFGGKTVGGWRVRMMAPNPNPVLPAIDPQSFHNMIASIASGNYSKQTALNSFSFTPDQIQILNQYQ